MADWDRNDDRSRTYDRDRDRDRDRGREDRGNWDPQRSFGAMEHYDRDRDRNFGRFDEGNRNQDWNRDRDWNRGSFQSQQDWNRNQDWNREQDRYRGSYQGQQDWNRNQDWNREQDRYRGSYQGQQDWNRNQDWNREQDRYRGSYQGQQDWNRDRGYNPDTNRDRDWDRSWTGDVANRGRDMTRGGTERFGYGSQGAYGYGYGTGSSMETGMRRGQFAGRGPKGWQRSDERIREDVNERLSDHPDVDASEVEVIVNNGEVTLRGSVDNRNEKRLAEDLAEEVRGVKDVHNEIKVSRSLWQRLTGQGEEEQTDRPATERGARAGAIGGQGTTGTGTKRA